MVSEGCNPIFPKADGGLPILVKSLIKLNHCSIVGDLRETLDDKGRFDASTLHVHMCPHVCIDLSGCGLSFIHCLVSADEAKGLVPSAGASATGCSLKWMRDFSHSCRWWVRSMRKAAFWACGWCSGDIPGTTDKGLVPHSGFVTHWQQWVWEIYFSSLGPSFLSHKVWITNADECI